jgi:hypothetical protein
LKEIRVKLIVKFRIDEQTLVVEDYAAKPAERSRCKCLMGGTQEDRWTSTYF